jgi:DNA (cytosine-5)-methyltransferase 1
MVIINNNKMSAQAPPELSTLTNDKLIQLCKEHGITKYSKKNKIQLIALINQHFTSTNNVTATSTTEAPMQTPIPIQSHSNSAFTFIDLFCGIGGFHQALTKLNGTCMFACDIDDNCRKVYENNYGIVPAGDITKVVIQNVPSHDVLCAGFPCQAYSKAGFQKGFNDATRGNLFFDMCKIIAHHKPKYLLLENVKNLTSHDNGNTWKVISARIDALGYYTYATPLVLNVLHFNVPQNRERVIIMCKRKDLGPLQPLPEIPTNPKLTLTVTIPDIVANTTAAEKHDYAITGKMKNVERIWDRFIQLLIVHHIPIPKFPIWTDWWDNELPAVLDKNTFETENKEENAENTENTENEEIDGSVTSTATAAAFYAKYKSWIDKNRAFYNQHIGLLEPWLSESRTCAQWLGAVRKFEWQAGDLLETDGMRTVLWTARGSGIRVKRPNYIPTLVAMSMIPIYGPESRKLTPRELLRLQSFPETFKYDEKTIFKQVGNAVNVKMIEQCARFLIFGEPIF